jgi:branched-chain amino acid transport system ATP-binding protein
MTGGRDGGGAPSAASARTAPAPLLAIEGVIVRYNAIPALHSVSLTVEKGEIVTLLGANGAGKTTTLRTISGLLRASSGRILFQGMDITRLRPHRVTALGISHVPEGRGIFTNLSVRDNLDLGAYLRSNTREIEEDFQRVFTLFPVLKDRARQTSGTLSGGEQQMLAIGRALMARPRLLLLDEPSLGLAPQLVDAIFRTIVEICREGTTILLVEQNAHKALTIANRGYVLETGRVVLCDESKNLVMDERVKHAYLGGG